MDALLNRDGYLVVRKQSSTQSSLGVRPSVVKGSLNVQDSAWVDKENPKDKNNWNSHNPHLFYIALCEEVMPFRLPLP